MRSWTSLLLRRLGTIVAVVWGAATIAFLAVKAVPGDPVAIISGGENIVDAEQRAAIAHQYGLDLPVPVQYLVYLGRAVTGNLGESYQYRRPVVSVLAEAAVPTAQLALSAFVVALALAFVSALTTAGRRPRLRAALAGLELVLLSTPVYWIGIVLLAVFSFWLGWFPVVATTGFRSLVLPAIALSLPLAALLSQVLRDGLEEALTEPFATTVRTRGVGETALRLRHVLRHALLATSTLTATMLASVLIGSVLTETVFGRAGIGQVTIQAIRTHDMPLVLGVVMLAALVFVVINTVVDALYLVIDPRLRPTSAPRSAVTPRQEAIA